MRESRGRRRLPVPTPRKPRVPKGDPPLRDPRCTGLVAEIGSPEMGTAERLRLARIVVERRLGVGWSARIMGRSTRDVLLKRRKAIAVGESWDLCERLLEDRDVASAEPSFELPGIEPDPATLTRWLTPGEIAERATSVAPPGRRRSAAAKDTPLACSASRTWSLDACNVPAAISLPLPGHGHGKKKGEGIVIGHPDTGYTDHAEIKGARLRIADGFDFLESEPDPRDELDGQFPGHGTGTASVIMSDLGGAGGSITGVAPLAQLVPIRVSKSVVHIAFENVADAIHLAVDRGCHVISMSLGGPLGPKYLHRAVRRAVDEGVVVLAAAGNQWPFVVFPARYDEVVSVAATNCLKLPWKGSARGPDVDVSAPGESVWRATAAAGTPPSFGESRGNGTSFAVATVAGACALWLAYHDRDWLVETYGRSNLAAVFREVLVSTAVPPSKTWKSANYGSGILDVHALLSAPLPPTAPAAGFAHVSRAARARSGSQVEAFLPYFPGEDAESVRRGLTAVLGASARRSANAITDHRDELLFHVATDPAFRDEIRRAAHAPAAMPVSSARRGARAAARPRAPRLASSRLLREMSG